MFSVIIKIDDNPNYLTMLFKSKETAQKYLYEMGFEMKDINHYRNSFNSTSAFLAPVADKSKLD